MASLLYPATVSEPEKLQVLILGGNGMMGSSFVSLLVSFFGPSNVNITLLNRGRKYWDSEVRVTPFVNHHITCDRKKVKRAGATLFKERNVFDYCIDFSAYKGKYVKSMLKQVQVRKRYIYISTDSVYEVCQRQGKKNATVESDAVRPSDENERARLNEEDDYGDQKLKGEEVLHWYAKNGESTGGLGATVPVKYVILRLPDVIGPRDNTDRIFNYILWLRTHQAIGMPLQLPSDYASRFLSFVHCDSVASALLACVRMTLEDDSLLRNCTFNLSDGIDDPGRLTLKQFLDGLAKHMGITDVAYAVEEDDDGTYYPSVTRGPISSRVARKTLGRYWHPMPIDSCIANIVAFYEKEVLYDKSGKFEEQKAEVCEDLIEELELSKPQSAKFFTHLEQFYFNAC